MARAVGMAGFVPAVPLFLRYVEASLSLLGWIVSNWTLERRLKVA
jgi:hypothetical protein